MTTSNEKELIEGVFSQSKSSRIGTGTTAKRVMSQALFYAKQVDEDVIEIQMLNTNHVPFGKSEQITKDDLFRDYLPMPQMYKQVMGNMRQVQKSIARGDKFRQRNEHFTAEFEYGKALSLDEENVRANFGIGLCLLARDEKEKAQEVFDRIVKIDSAFENEHKHLFNEYGIALRKKKLLDQAVEYYNRAIELSGDDENLWYNLAYAEFSREDWPKCGQAINKCLEIAPDHPEGKKMLAYLAKKNLI